MLFVDRVSLGVVASRALATEDRDAFGGEMRLEVRPRHEHRVGTLYIRAHRIGLEVEREAGALASLGRWGERHWSKLEKLRLDLRKPQILVQVVLDRHVVGLLLGHHR